VLNQANKPVLSTKAIAVVEALRMLATRSPLPSCREVCIALFGELQVIVAGNTLATSPEVKLLVAALRQPLPGTYPTPPFHEECTLQAVRYAIYAHASDTHP
jgi:hypothetical protein